MPNRKLLTLALAITLVALLVAVGYWNVSPERFLDNPKASVDAATIDSYATNAHTVQYLPDGSMQYDMTADRVEHLKASEITHVTKPVMDVYRGTTFPWHVVSERAEVNPDGTQVELIDAVRLNRTDQQNRVTVITTSRAMVFPQKQYAETDQDVRIEGAGGVTTAKGMKAYLNDSKIHLLSTVRGQYEAR
jgi:lipopolysaccharide export system protein LptC